MEPTFIMPPSLAPRSDYVLPAKLASDASRAAAPILVVGESVIDIVTTDAGAEESPGGSPANVALGLGRLGHQVRFHTAIAQDPHGQLIAQKLEASGVTIDPASWALARTSTAHAAIGADGSARYSFDIDSRLAEPVLGSATNVHVGSVSMFMAPGAKEVQALVESLPSHVVLSVDPNIRPALLDSKARAVSELESILRRTQIIKLSDEDAQWLYPQLTHDDLLNYLLNLGARLAVITRGSSGAILAAPHARIEVDAQPVNVADTIGAGDTFMAALIDGSLRHPQLLQKADDTLLRLIGNYATSAAALTVQRHGADLPWAEELGMLPFHRTLS